MKKITDEYANKVLEPILQKYIEDENVIELYNAVNEADSDLLSLALFFAQRIDITRYLETKLEKMPDLEETIKMAMDSLEENKETIQDVADVVAFNNPNLKQVMDILNTPE